MFLKQIKGLSSVLRGSSGYWTEKLSNLGNEFCSCTRGVIEPNAEMEVEKKIEDQNNFNSDLIYLKGNKKINLFF